VPAATPPTLPPAARQAILEWYATAARPLAFRRTTDPYAILVSEAMAQQTQAARAAEHWERFLERFPTVEALAAASPADVLRAWAGLGYDRRALALWRAARIIVDEHGGQVPSDIAALQALPGVGPYTARAVAALAHGVPVGAVDVNVRRVLGRAVAGSPDALTAVALQAVADEVVPRDDPGRWTHALMDLGATICRPRTPRCDDCPIRTWCRAVADGTAGLPRTTGPRTRTAAPAIPFPSTNRWLRGRILDRLRAATADGWVALDGPIGEHGPDRVAAAVEAMARDGVIELHPDRRSAQARLPTS